MKITFLGHASLSIEVEDVVILVDPFISGNPKASQIDVNTLKADYILVTHAHQDHILDVESIAKRTEATIISRIISHDGNLPNHENTPNSKNKITTYTRPGIGWCCFVPTYDKESIVDISIIIANNPRPNGESNPK